MGCEDKATNEKVPYAYGSVTPRRYSGVSNEVLGGQKAEGVTRDQSTYKKNTSALMRAEFRTSRGYAPRVKIAWCNHGASIGQLLSRVGWQGHVEAKSV